MRWQKQGLQLFKKGVTKVAARELDSRNQIDINFGLQGGVL
jgi:hypothetical protein